MAIHNVLTDYLCKIVLAC